MITYFADTDGDFTPSLAAEYGYKLISMPYCVNGENIYPYEDFETFDSKAFYDMLRGGTLPTTSALSKERYIEYFEPEFEAGNDICYVHFSEAMTATFSFMRKAVEELKQKYPERKFYEIDTKGITILSYAVTKEIGKLIKSGKTIEEILDWANVEVDKFAMYFYADDLKFFRRSGRVSGLAATMGTLIGIRPIIAVDQKGVMGNVGKERGRKNAVKRLLTYVEELGDDIKNYEFVIGHTDCTENAEELAAELRKEFGNDLKIETVMVNPTAGSHCGPNGVGVCFHAVHR